MTDQLAKRKRVSGTIIQLPQQQAVIDPLKTIVNVEAEEAVIGAVLRDPECYASVSEVLQPSDFFMLWNGYIWHAFDRISGRGEAVDMVSVADELDALGQLPPEGVHKLAGLAESAPNSHSAETYARIVRDAATRLRICRESDEMKKIALDRMNYRDIEAVVDECNRLLFEATDQQMKRKDTSVKAIVGTMYESVEKALQSGVTRGIPTGFNNLDELLKGGVPGELTILAGGEGMGKTTFALNLALNMARGDNSHKRNFNVVIFTLEMSEEEIVRILISMVTGIPKRALKAADLNGAQWQKFVEGVGIVGNLNIHVIDEFPSLTPIQLRRRLRTMVDAQKQEVDAVIVDGLWLMEDTEATPAAQRPIAVRNITRDLITIGRDFDVPMYVTHQYNGEAWQRNNKRPMMHDLAESAGVRRNAQVIIGLYRDNYYGIESEYEITEAHVLKDRNGSGAQGQHADFLFDMTHNLFKPVWKEGQYD